MPRPHPLLASLHDADFTRIFIECGWSNPTTPEPYVLAQGETTYAFREAAQMRGYRVFVCRVDSLPDLSTCRWLDSRLRRRSNDYLAIYIAPPSPSAPMHHLWAVPVTTDGKRQLVKIEYASDDWAPFLSEKLSAVTFSLDESPSIVDVVARVNAAFLVNAAEVTKRFYRDFRTQHNLFVKGIQGLSDPADRDWYASVMLNRLMFCYFIQKRGFLSGDLDYLSKKLAWVQSTRGQNHFHSFYRSFLLRLFREGLDTPASDRTPDWNTADFGRIPYLNGGMFAEHPLEKDNPSLDIPDETFARLFSFFDQWRWHLDTRISSTGRDINPDVLGYIFEQYINDRAQMGAYYTKEDITGYITRNTLLPWLLSEVQRKGHPDLYASLPASGDRYIFPAMLKGIDAELPGDIAQGIPPEPQSTLRQRRAHWNRPADPALALPTETWRETIARRARTAELRQKIKTGAVRSPDDFTTLNLDIRAFAEDLLRNTPDHLLVLHFYDALRRVTILDPTCGSGAFLFAALDILEPLYDACLDRMEDFHTANPRLFKDQLAELATARNRQYHIYKSIILRNLYGVDLMHEATEIARLRLFLKLVSAVDPDPRDPNLGLDPLPDIDFNIRTGNTLVGFANPDDVKTAITPPGSLAIFDDEYRKIEVQAQDTADIYERFKALQFSSEGTAEFHNAKNDLDARLASLNDTLDHALARSVFQIPPSKFNAWKAKAQPFHWFSDFYVTTIANKGFDVIIGNPPYVEYSETGCGYSLDDSYTTKDCRNLYAYCIERSQTLLNKHGRFGMIVPNSAISANKMRPVQHLITNNKRCWISNYSWRPAKLFEGANMLLAILLTVELSAGETQTTNATQYQKWYNEFREYLFSTLTYFDISDTVRDGTIAKMPSSLVKSILWKMARKSGSQQIGQMFLPTPTHHVAYYFRAVLYWFKVLDRVPIYDEDGEAKVTTEMKPIYFNNVSEKEVVIAFLSSNLFFLNYIIWSSCQVVNARDFEVGFDYNSLSQDTQNALVLLGKKLQADYQRNSKLQVRNYSKKGRVFTMKKQYFFIKHSKPIIDEIDALLARHYGFTEEELDYIINYDIKYRMGDRLEEG